MKDPSQFDHEFFPGIQNRAIRYYFYLNAGLAIVNNFRNLFLGIIGLYFVLKLDNWILLVAMFIPSAIILTVVGYIVVHKVNKVSEWLSLRFSSHYGMKQYNLQEGIYETLQEINNKMK